jgi:hypothetical protein
MTRIALFNDTSAWHSGSAAVVSVIRSWFTPEEITTVLTSRAHSTLTRDHIDFDAFDAVVFNAEGTCHHNARAAMFWLRLLSDCKRRGKPVAMVNATWAEMSDEAIELIRDFDYISTREQLSTLEMRCGGVYPQEFIDLSVVAALTVVPTPSPLPTLRRGIILGTNWRKKQLNPKAGPDAINLGVPSGGAQAFTDFVQFLRKACIDTYVTGQFHGVCAAAAAGVNVVYTPGNCHKIEGMVASSGLPIPCFRPSYVLNRIAIAARFTQPMFHEWAIRTAMKTAATLPLGVRGALHV